jgi:hypothetical protein
MSTSCFNTTVSWRSSSVGTIPHQQMMHAIELVGTKGGTWGKAGNGSTAIAEDKKE